MTRSGRTNTIRRAVGKTVECNQKGRRNKWLGRRAKGMPTQWLCMLI